MVGRQSGKEVLRVRPLLDNSCPDQNSPPLPSAPAPSHLPVNRVGEVQLILLGGVNFLGRGAGALGQGARTLLVCFDVCERETLSLFLWGPVSYPWAVLGVGGPQRTAAGTQA